MSREAAAPPEASDEECARGNEKHDDQEVADDRYSGNGVHLRKGRSVERVLVDRLKSGSVGIEFWHDRAIRLEDGLPGKGDYVGAPN